jgi:plasmid maintenance system antidote protein VapI
MNLQKTYELDLARKEAGEEINSIPRRKPARRAAPAAEHSAH